MTNGQRVGAAQEHPNTAQAGLTVPAGILGTGLHVPPSVVTNADLARTLDTSDEWIQATFGISQRRFLADGRTTSDMCVDAALQALDAARTSPAEIDAIVLATITPDHPVPSTAIIVAERIGARRAVPLDLTQTACASGVLAVIVASHLLQSSAFRKVLVIGADTMSRLTDPEERTTRVIFGDAAGALVMGRVEAGYGLLSWDIGTEQSYAVGVRAGGASRPTGPDTLASREHYARMDGRAVWRVAIQHLPGSIRAAAMRAGLSVGDITHFALHQANQRIIAKVMGSLGVPVERAGLTIGTLGNTCSASMLSVLHGAFDDGRVQRGDTLLVAGIGAGFLWGALCLKVW